MENGSVFKSVLYRAVLFVVLVALFASSTDAKVLAQEIIEPRSAIRSGADVADDAVGAYYVRYKAGQKRAALASMRTPGVQVIHVLDVVDTVAVVASADKLDDIRKDPNVAFVEPVPEHSLAAQGVPWNIDMVQARDVWDADRDGAVDPGAPDGNGVKLCIIDSGFYAAHDDFQGIVASGESQITGEDWWEDGVGHGTHVAGVANAMNNDTGVVGVLPGGAELYIVKVFDNDGNWISGQSNLAAAAQACRDAGANAISMSLGGSYSATEEALFQDLYDNYGIINIAAGGSDGLSDARYPASYDSVISVAGVRDDEVVASFSHYPATGYDPDNPPANVEWDVIELSAGGEGILSTVPYVDGDVPFYQVTPDGGDTYSGYHIDESGFTSPSDLSRILVNGGVCDSIGAWSGNIVLCERGSVSFADKVNNVQDGGGLGAIIYNNQPGTFNGTCGGNCYADPIPAISLSQADGQALLASVGGNSTLVVDDGSNCTTCTGGYDYMSGSSMATPAVAAGIAWMWDNCGGPTGITNKQLRQLLRDSAKDLSGTRQDDDGDDHTYGIGYDIHSGWGLIQLKDALDLGGERYGWQVCLPVGPFVIDPSPRRASVCTLSPADVVYDLDVGGKDFQGYVDLSAMGYPAGTSATFADSSVSVPNAGDWAPATLTIGNTGIAATGRYTVNVHGVDQTDVSNTFDVDVLLNVVPAAPLAASLTSPADGSTGVASLPTFTWIAVAGADSYAIEVATDPNFDNIVAAASGLVDTNYTPATVLASDTVYYWRVRADNVCGDTVSTTAAFRIGGAPSCGAAVLDDPSFELGTAVTFPWTQKSTNSAADTPLCTTADCGGPPPGPSDGTWWGWFGGFAATELAFLEQNVVLPTGATSIALNFDFQAAACNRNQDYFRIFVDHDQVFNVEQGDALCGASDYSRQSIDLTAYPGNHTLLIEGYSRGNWRGWSNFHIDNLEVVATCPPAAVTVADYSDLAGSYGIAWHTGDGSLRLGANWSADVAFGSGDDDTDDDGIIFTEGFLYGAEIPVQVDVRGTPAGANGWLRSWFDWNNNGVFDTEELAHNQAVAVGLNELTVSVPATLTTVVHYRFRLYDNATAPVAPLALDSQATGGASGGEIEDGVTPVPTAVTLVHFAAHVEEGGVGVTWETASEIDNLGFNLYRSTSADGPYAQINTSLIPTQHPGQVLGAVYSWLDAEAPAGVTLYYKLEDVDVNGKRALHGPVSTNAMPSPSAVNLVSLAAQGNSGYVTIVVLVVVCVGVTLLHLLARRRRYQTVRCAKSTRR